MRTTSAPASVSPRKISRPITLGSVYYDDDLAFEEELGEDECVDVLGFKQRHLVFFFFLFFYIHFIIYLFLWFFL